MRGNRRAKKFWGGAEQAEMGAVTNREPFGPSGLSGEKTNAQLGMIAGESQLQRQNES